jgi:hypothetical protein
VVGAVVEGAVVEGAGAVVIGLSVAGSGVVASEGVMTSVGVAGDKKGIDSEIASFRGCRFKLVEND